MWFFLLFLACEGDDPNTRVRTAQEADAVEAQLSKLRGQLKKRNATLIKRAYESYRTLKITSSDCRVDLDSALSLEDDGDPMERTLLLNTGEEPLAPLSPPFGVFETRVRQAAKGRVPKDMKVDPALKMAKEYRFANPQYFIVINRFTLKHNARRRGEKVKKGTDAVNLYLWDNSINRSICGAELTSLDGKGPLTESDVSAVLNQGLGSLKTTMHHLGEP